MNHSCRIHLAHGIIHAVGRRSVRKTTPAKLSHPTSISSGEKEVSHGHEEGEEEEDVEVTSPARASYWGRALASYFARHLSLNDSGRTQTRPLLFFTALFYIPPAFPIAVFVRTPYPLRCVRYAPRMYQQLQVGGPVHEVPLWASWIRAIQAQKPCRSQHSSGWLARSDAGESGPQRSGYRQRPSVNFEGEGLARKSGDNNAAGPECGQLRRGEQSKRRDAHCAEM